MPFNSYLFLLLFLPAAVGGYHLVALTRLRRLRVPVLILFTLAFYAVAAARWLPLLLGSIAVNAGFARAIARSAGRQRSAILTAGVALDVAVLLGFKYTGFVAANVAAVSGLALPVPHVALPLALSFYTFQQIAFLVDTARGKGPPPRVLPYAASILFFPIIISGPITLHRELAPQLEAERRAQAVPGDLLIGFSLFAIGLFKKTVIADSFLGWVDPLFGRAAAGAQLGAAAAWGLTLAFLLQMYFDFSGYSDMASGIARMFGVRLPINFFSPLRATSIIEWWRRWHMTLGRFVGEYIFQPLALPLTRWAAARGLGRRGILAAGTLLPSFVAMLVIGAWHGGNWTFVVFGVLHASYMVTAESWRFATRKRRKARPPRWWHHVAGNVLTIVAVLVALVPFRAPDMTTALRLWRAMIGVAPGGVARWPVLAPAGGWGLAGMIAVGLGIAYLLPNAAQIMTRAQPALEWERWRNAARAPIRFAWAPSAAWAFVTGAVLLIAAAFVSRGTSSFVYFGY